VSQVRILPEARFGSSGGTWIPGPQPLSGGLLDVPEQQVREAEAADHDDELAVELVPRVDRHDPVFEGVAKQLEQRHVHEIERERGAASDDHRPAAQAAVQGAVAEGQTQHQRREEHEHDRAERRPVDQGDHVEPPADRGKGDGREPRR
jgi:hypothetical protein